MNDLDDVYERARSRFDRVLEKNWPERQQSLNDRRFAFIAGAQWEGNLGLQYENRPKFELNKIMVALTRLFNQYRNNRISVKFQPRLMRKNRELADVEADDLTALYRADEHDSCAEESRDNAFDEGGAGGIGAWKLIHEHEDDDNEDDDHQRIRWSPIFDADKSVFFDENSKSYDRRDAKWCIHLESMDKHDFMAEYDDDPVDWPEDLLHSGEFDWVVDNTVWIAHYYEKVKESVTYVWFRDILGNEEKYLLEDLEAEPEMLDNLLDIGSEEVRRRKITRNRVKKYILSGAKVVEDCGYIAGRNLPIVMFYGKRAVIDGIERASGEVRFAKDASRLKNMQASQLAEVSASSGVETPIVTPGMMRGHQLMWSERNIKNFGYLLLNAFKDKDGNESLPALQYTKVPNIPPALAALLQLTESDLRDILGNQGEMDKMVSNISEETVSMMQDRVDGKAYIYLDNMAKSIRWEAEIWLDMARDLYVEENRVMRGLGAEGDDSEITINHKKADENGVPVTMNDVASAKMDVFVTVGPDTSSKRKSTVKSLLNMLQITKDQQNAKILESLAIMNMEGEGVSDVRSFFRDQLVKMGAVQPSKEEAEKMAKEAENAKPSPDEEFLLASAEKERSQAIENQSKAALNQAKTDETRAKIAEILSAIEREDFEVAGKMLQLINSGGGASDIDGTGIQ